MKQQQSQRLRQQQQKKSVIVNFSLAKQKERKKKKLIQIKNHVEFHWVEIIHAAVSTSTYSFPTPFDWTRSHSIKKLADDDKNLFLVKKK